MGFFESIGQGVKAVAASLAPAPSAPFAQWGGQGLVANVSGTYQPVINRNTSPGARKDFAELVGDVGDNSIVMACVSTITEAFTAAPLILEQYNGKTWERVLDHPFVKLLERPNPYYGVDHLWHVTLTSEICTGNGFWKCVWNRARTQPVELWWEPFMAPKYDAHTFIDHYWLRVEGGLFKVGAAANYKPTDKERIDHAVHFRYHVDRRNPRYGTSPILSVLREVYGDNLGASYHTALLENGAAASFFLTGKEAAATPLTTKQMEEILSGIERRLRREGAGRVAGTNLPVDLHKVGFSPDELALDKLPVRYESRICAVLKVPAMMLGLTSGEDTKTYSNMGEAIDDFWHRTIIPLQDRKGSELESQLFPLFEMDRAEYRVNWDRSQIIALQDDENSMYERLFKACGQPFITVNEAREKAKLPPVPTAPQVEETAPEDGGDASDADTGEGDDTEEQKRAFRFEPEKGEALKMDTDVRGVSHHRDHGKFATNDNSGPLMNQTLQSRSLQDNGHTNATGEGGASGDTSDVPVMSDERFQQMLDSRRSEAMRDAAKRVTGDREANAELKAFAAHVKEGGDPNNFSFNRWAPIGPVEATNAPASERVNVKGRKSQAVENRMTNNATGAHAEALAADYFLKHGAAQVLTRRDKANNAIDLIVVSKSGRMSYVEVKGCQSDSAGKKWKVSPGYTNAEKALLTGSGGERVSPQQRTQLDKVRVELAMERKSELLETARKQTGKKIAAQTLGVIINPDTGRADMHLMPGYHVTMGWNSEQANRGYKGTVSYDGSTVKGKGTKADDEPEVNASGEGADEPELDELTQQFTSKPDISDAQMLDLIKALAGAYPDNDDELSGLDSLLEGDTDESTGYPEDGIEYDEGDYPDDDESVDVLDKEFWAPVLEALSGGKTQ